MSTPEQDQQEQPAEGTHTGETQPSQGEGAEQQGDGDNIDTQINESPDVVVQTPPAEGTSTGESDPGQGGDGSGGESK